ncbi:hypothetical protein MKW98_022280 [Papaver atlanticum]|uniref:beta-galactosidase n=1 Tax=Papaver atlanticum TaxID=357466 RepID=A0AAD4T688_9MAGN|nr:hypothetical protein MKW98_022280 [Papaver atlanticum]
MAVCLAIGVLWVMCKQDDAPDPIINICNCFYCDWFPPNRRYKPKIWTENWTDWFTEFGGPAPHRPAEGLAFSVAKFIQKGGSFMNYYIYHGGTNFVRTTGGPFIGTSYDYDAPLDEFGLLREPKWGHLRDLHRAIKLCEPALVYSEPAVKIIGDKQEAHVFNYKSGGCPAFLAKYNTKYFANVAFGDMHYHLPPWSISILPDCKTTVFNNVGSRSAHMKMTHSMGSLGSRSMRSPLPMMVVRLQYRVFGANKYHKRRDRLSVVLDRIGGLTIHELQFPSSTVSCSRKRLTMLGQTSVCYPSKLQGAFRKFLEDSNVNTKKGESIFEILCLMFDGSLDTSLSITDSKSWFSLEHPTRRSSKILKALAVDYQKLASIAYFLTRKFHSVFILDPAGFALLFEACFPVLNQEWSVYELTSYNLLPEEEFTVEKLVLNNTAQDESGELLRVVSLLCNISTVTHFAETVLFTYAEIQHRCSQLFVKFTEEVMRSPASRRCCCNRSLGWLPASGSTAQQMQKIGMLNQS